MEKLDNKIVYKHTENKAFAYREFDREIKNFMQIWNLPGASVALAKDGKIHYRKVFGKADSETELKADNIFRIASLSKPITALAIMVLVEQGKLKPDDLVFGEKGVLNALNYRNIQDQRIYKITVKHLLQHRGGWDRETSQFGDPMFHAKAIGKILGFTRKANPEHIIRFMLDKPLDFMPGSRFAYSNFGYNILGRIVEKLSSLKYEAFVQKHILAPLNISDVKLGRSWFHNKYSDEVWYYAGKDKVWLPNDKKSRKSLKTKLSFGKFKMEVLDASCGWVSSAESLAKILMAIHPDTRENRILKSETAKLIQQAAVLNRNYGLGWFIHPDLSWSHHGCLPGSSAMMQMNTSGFSWVILFNSWPDNHSFLPALEDKMTKAVKNLKTELDFSALNKMAA